MQQVEIAIIGAGPIGLELALALKKRGIDYLHFDKGQVAQTMSWFPKQMHFFSSNDRICIAGVPIQTVDQQKATREEYMAYLRQVVRAFDLDVRTFEAVENIERDDGGFVLHTRRNNGEHHYRANRIALVVGDMHLPRKIGVPGEDLPHVSHYFDEPHEFFRRRLLVIGGKNSAVEAALRSWHIGAHVGISYRRGEFNPEHVKYWLLPELQGRIRRGEIDGYLRTAPVRITPTHVTLRHVERGDEFDVEADAVLLMTGYTSDTTLLEKAGIELIGDERTPVHDELTMETNVPGVYVAGTAAAGSQKEYRLFIENCHIHVDRIVAHVTGAEPPAAPRPQWRPES